MHIPDGYLSPASCVVLTAAVVPFWIRATTKVKKIVKSRYVPYVAIAAAFSFLVMMFNIPVPDGTTAHAVGAVMIAIVLGPWAAVIAVSISLIIQALFFGDGGVLALGANCLNMAVIMPFIGYAVYKLIAGRAPLTSGRRVMAAAIAGYVGINVAALAAAIEFGVQPTLFHTANGTPLYAPFHLAQTIPVMLFAHLTVAGLAEAAVSAGVVAYLQRANVPLLRLNAPDVPASEAEMERRKPLGWKWILIGAGAVILLTPIGLLAPGGAFGEDAPHGLELGRYGLNAVPVGLERFSSFWSHTLLGGYGFGDGQHPNVGYIISAIVGVAVVTAVVLFVFFVVRALLGTGDEESETGDVGRVGA